MRGPVARALAVFWGAAVLLRGIGALVLQLLGPPVAGGKAAVAAAAILDPAWPTSVAAEASNSGVVTVYDVTGRD